MEALIRKLVADSQLKKKNKNKHNKEQKKKPQTPQ